MIVRAHWVHGPLALNQFHLITCRNQNLLVEDVNYCFSHMMVFHIISHFWGKMETENISFFKNISVNHVKTVGGKIIFLNHHPQQHNCHQIQVLL